MHAPVRVRAVSVCRHARMHIRTQRNTARGGGIARLRAYSVLSLQVDVFLNGRRTHLQMRIHNDGRLVFPQWNNSTTPQVSILSRALSLTRARGPPLPLAPPEPN